MIKLSKKSIFIFVCLTFAFVAQGVGQDVLNSQISFSKTTGSTLFFLKEIEKQSNVVFSYSTDLCFYSSHQLLTSSRKLQDVLDELFLNCPADYIVKGNKIIIEPRRNAVKRFVIRGYIRDSQTQEALIQSNVFDVKLASGTVSNSFGFYSLTLPQGKTNLIYSYVGFKDAKLTFDLQKDTVIDLSLHPLEELSEVAVVGNESSGQLMSTRTSTINLAIDQLKNVPYFLGEADVVKGIQLLPGVQSGGEGFSGLYVRGGGPDQNLVLMDDVPVYNVDHLLGFFSIFNSDAVNNVTVIKGGFPARYGGRLSSVVDIRMYDGNNTKFKGSASIGLISSNIALEGPIIKDKSSFSVSFRRTYFDVITGLYQLSDAEKTRYYFYDFNSKLSFKLSPRDKLYFSTYAGKDNYQVSYNEQTMSLTSNAQKLTNDESGISWRNYIAATRWTHIFGEKVFSNLVLNYSDYRFDITQTQNYVTDGLWNYSDRNYFSGIRDYSAKIDVDYTPSPNHYIRTGTSFVRHAFYPGIDIYSSQVQEVAVVDTTYGGKDVYRSELRAYIEDDFHISSKIKLNLGVHYSAFFANNSHYWSLEPRLSARYLFLDNVALKMAYSEMNQYIHLLRTASLNMPTDIWLPVSNSIEPMQAKQFAVGLEYDLWHSYLFSIEGYYKAFDNIITYKTSSGFFDSSTDWSDKLSSGTGISKGLELMVHKKTGKLSGWVGYTYSKSTNQFDDINNGVSYPSNFDRTHYLSVYASYKFSKNIDGGLTWVFGTGNPITLPETKYYAPALPTQDNVLNSKYNEHVSNRNTYRMPNFHRMDVGVNFNKDKSWGRRIWSVGVINVYGRQNPFFLYFSDSEDQLSGEIQRSLKQFSLFPIPIPYVRYTIKF